MTVEAQHFPAGSPGHPGLPPVSGRKKKRDRMLARPTWLLEQQHVSWGSVHGQRAGLLDRAVGSAGHAVAAPGVGKPEVLGRDIQEACISPDLLGKGVWKQSSSQNSGDSHPRRVLERAIVTYLCVYRDGLDPLDVHSRALL